MSKYAVTVRKSDGAVTGTWAGRGPEVPVQTNPDIETHEVTAADYDRLQQVRLLREMTEDYRWTSAKGPDGIGVLTRTTDTRPEIEFVPAVVEAFVGDSPAPEVEVRILKANGGVATNVSGARRIFTGDQDMQLEFVAGVATLAIPVHKKYRIDITHAKRFKVKAPLRIRVLSKGLEIR